MAAKQIKSTRAAAKARAIATGKGPVKKSAKKELTSSSAKLTNLRNQGGKEIKNNTLDWTLSQTKRVRDYQAEDRANKATRTAVKAGVSSRSIKKAIKKGESNVTSGNDTRWKNMVKTNDKIRKADRAMGNSMDTGTASRPKPITKQVKVRGK